MMGKANFTSSLTTIPPIKPQKSIAGCYVIHAFICTSLPLAVPGSTWVERFFARITTEAIRRGSFSSVRQLQAAIDAYLAEHNKEPKPFTWTASADSIFRKLENSLS